MVGRCKGQRFCGGPNDGKGGGGLTACEKLTGSQALCVDTQCDGKKDGVACDDGDKCTKNDACAGGNCKPGDDICECKQTADCVDKDGDPCTGVPFCDKSGPTNVCKINPSTVVTCSAEGDTACSKNTCDPKTKKCKKKAMPTTVPCDDGKPCTQSDRCDGKGACKSGTNTCKCMTDDECEKSGDGNPCNGVLYCDKSTLPYACKVNQGSIIKCDGSGDTDCTKNACDKKTGACKVGPANETKACNDGDKCTKGEACSAGACTGGTYTCPCSKHAECVGQDDGNLCNGVMYCHKASGTCRVNTATKVYCPSVKDTACLRNICEVKTGVCALTIVNNKGECIDGNPCTKSESCDQGECKSETSLCACEKNADCVGKGGKDKCIAEMYCDKTFASGGKKAQCRPNPAKKVVCPSVDDTKCAENRCDATTGKCKMTARNDGDACEADGDHCTDKDVCAAGTCKAGPSTCACKTTADCADLEDGLTCNGTLVCDTSLAKPVCVVDKKTIVTCKAATGPCTTNVCLEPKGTCQVTGLPDGAPCDDDDPCTASEGCFNGKCSKHTKVCGCTKAADCVLFNNTTDLCSGAMTCNTKLGKCVLGPKPTCDDNNACTKDSCDPKKGCQNLKTVICDDNDKCTVDICTPKIGCDHSKAVDCDDKNPCTKDECVAAKGCMATKLSDGAACTTSKIGNGACKAGVCAAKPAPTDADRDGVADDKDKCPTVWNPGQDPKVCGFFDKNGWLGSAPVKLGTSAAGHGKSTERRTNEVVDVPLANGIADESLLGHWKLNSTLKAHRGGAAAGTGEIVGTPENQAGPFDAIVTSFDFDGQTDGVIVGKGRTFRLKDRYTVSLWFREQGLGKGEILFGTTAGSKCVGEGLHVAVKKAEYQLVVAGKYFGSMARKNDGSWHQLTITRNGDFFRAFIDGTVMLRKTFANASTNDCGNGISLGLWSLTNGKKSLFLKARVAELAVFDRPLSPAEIGAYYASKAPYASTFVPGARETFSDVRAVEFASKGPHMVHQELIGVRKHDERDTVAKHLVMPLDGKIVEYVGKKTGAKLLGSIKWATGRFGDANGALELDGKTAVDSKSTVALVDKQGWAIEAWIKIPKLPLTAGTILGAFPKFGAALAFKVHKDGSLKLVLLNDAHKGFTHGPPNQPFKVIPGRWHHVAVNVAEGTKISFYVDGLRSGISGIPGASYGGDSTVKLPLAIGAVRNSVNNLTDRFEGRIDELVIHAKSRSPGYFRHRARGLPKLRFMASTEPVKAKDNSYHPRLYQLYWGKATATPLATRITALDGKTACDHIVSHCLGTVAWWRMEDLGGGTVVDDAAWGQHGVLKLNTRVAMGIAGWGLKLDGGHVEVPHDARQWLPQHTVEGSVRPTENAKVRPIVSKGSKKQMDKKEERWAYHLGLNATNKVVGWLHDDFPSHRLESTFTVSKNTWTSAGIKHNGKTMVLTYNGKSVGSRGAPYTYKPLSTMLLGAMRTSAGHVTSATRGVLDEVRISNRALNDDELLHFPAFSHGLVARDPLSCDDGNVCTLDVFAATGKCAQLPVSKGTACTTSGGKGTCEGTVCKAPCGLFDKPFVEKTNKQSAFEDAVGLEDGLTAFCGYKGAGGNTWAARVGVLNKTGNVSWEKSYGSTDHRCLDLVAAEDGNVIATGAFKPTAQSSSHAWLLKFKPNGQTLLDKKNIGSANNSEVGLGVIEFEKGYVIAGERKFISSGQKAFGWVTHVDSLGTKVWDGSVGVGQHSVVTGSIAPADDDGLLAAFTVRPAATTHRRPEVFRLDEKGRTLWSRQLATGTGLSELKFVALPTGTFLGYGSTNQKGAGGLDCWAVHLSDVGDVVWEQTYGGAGHESCSGVVARGKNPVLTGYRTLQSGQAVGWMFALDAKGKMSWDKTVQHGDGHMHLRSAGETKTGGLVLSGWQHVNKLKSGWVMRTDGWGESDCSKSGKCAEVTNLCAVKVPCIVGFCDAKTGCSSKPDLGCIPPKHNDLDRDELVGDKDGCPTVWNPDNEPTVCAEVNKSNFKRSKVLNIHQPGFSGPWAAQRRTNEPVEIALQNGIRDSSLVASWHFDNKLVAVDGSTPKVIGKVSYANGPFDSEGLALQLDGKSGVQLWDKRQFEFEAE